MKKQILFPIVLVLGLLSIWMIALTNEYEINNTKEDILSYLNDQNGYENGVSELVVKRIEDTNTLFIQFQDGGWVQHVYFRMNESETKLKIMEDSYSYGDDGEVDSVKTDKGYYTVVTGKTDNDSARKIVLNDYESGTKKTFDIHPYEHFFYAFPSEADSHWEMNYLDSYGEEMYTY